LILPRRQFNLTHFRGESRFWP